MNSCFPALESLKIDGPHIIEIGWRFWTKKIRNSKKNRPSLAGKPLRQSKKSDKISKSNPRKGKSNKSSILMTQCLAWVDLRFTFKIKLKNEFEIFTTENSLESHKTTKSCIERKSSNYLCDHQTMLEFASATQSLKENYSNFSRINTIIKFIYIFLFWMSVFIHC